MTDIHFDSKSAPRPPFQVVLTQSLRWLLKKTVWTTLTTLCKRLGRPIQTIQVLVVDRPHRKFLCLATPEGEAGYTPIQGLRQAGFDFAVLNWTYTDSPELDAWRELAEEALEPESAETLKASLHLVRRYWEGYGGQFDCRVYLAEGDSAGLQLRSEHGEGRPVWLAFESAAIALKPPLLDILAALPAAGTPLVIEVQDRIGAPA